MVLPTCSLSRSGKSPNLRSACKVGVGRWMMGRRLRWRREPSPPLGLPAARDCCHHTCTFSLGPFCCCPFSLGPLSIGLLLLEHSSITGFALGKCQRYLISRYLEGIFSEECILMSKCNTSKPISCTLANHSELERTLYVYDRGRWWRWDGWSQTISLPS